ncbi:MAG TPA: hypothetical protein VHT31_07095, partial [Candidatus Acidoferrum sp.]|nr:hypothetical protein [Candidatus Acidoferrum sp.]
HGISAVFLALLATAISIWIAWRDVKISARVMLWIEAVSVSLILILIMNGAIPSNDPYETAFTTGQRNS